MISKEHFEMWLAVRARNTGRTMLAQLQREIERGLWTKEEIDAVGWSRAWPYDRKEVTR